MLRLLVLALVLANALYYAWAHGLLAAYGFAPTTQSEPQRLAQQLRPDMLRQLTALEVRQLEAAPAPAPAIPTECLQAGLFTDAQTAALRSRLQSSLPAASWVLESAIEPARWMVYMGKYAGVEAVTRKKGELRQLSVSFEPLNNPALEPGLSLGTFASQADADAELARIAKRGVRTAKVIASVVESRGQKLKLAQVDAALRTQLDAIKPELAGKPLQPCR